jgi:hypothetical protein
MNAKVTFWPTRRSSPLWRQAGLSYLARPLSIGRETDCLVFRTGVQSRASKLGRGPVNVEVASGLLQANLDNLNLETLKTDRMSVRRSAAVRPVLVEARNLSKIYRRDEVEVVAFEHVSLDVHEGEFLAPMGPSGSERVRYSTSLPN